MPSLGLICLIFNNLEELLTNKTPTKTKGNKTMSEATLTSLLEYLYGALTPSNQRWLAAHLAQQTKDNLKS